MKLQDERIVICGAGGFLGGPMTKILTSRGVNVIRAIDIKPIHDWYQTARCTETMQANLKSVAACERAVDGATVLFNLAADMGGMGFMENNKALCILSVLLNAHLLLASMRGHVKRYFCASSACVYTAKGKSLVMLFL